MFLVWLYLIIQSKKAFGSGCYHVLGTGQWTLEIPPPIGACEFRFQFQLRFVLVDAMTQIELNCLLKSMACNAILLLFHPLHPNGATRCKAYIYMKMRISMFNKYSNLHYKAVTSCDLFKFCPINCELNVTLDHFRSSNDLLIVGWVIGSSGHRIEVIHLHCIIIFVK